MDSLITVIIFVIIAVFSAWSQKKSREAEAEDVWTDEEPETTAPPPVQRRGELQQPPSPKPPGRSHWEEELRRLLEGEKPRPRPQHPTPPPPPPVIVGEGEGSGPFPATIPTARPVPPSPYAQPAPRHSAPMRPHAPAHVPQPVTMVVQPPGYQKASQLFETVSDHFQHVGQHKLPATSVQHSRQRSREVNEVVGMFRNAHTARKAVIASFILGPCKAVEERAC